MYETLGCPLTRTFAPTIRVGQGVARDASPLAPDNQRVKDEPPPKSTPPHPPPDLPGCVLRVERSTAEVNEFQPQL